MSSPQGRFAAGAARIDGRTMIDAQAVGKQMFLEFDNGLWLRVHLGIYGAWDFAGDISVDPTIAPRTAGWGRPTSAARSTSTGDAVGENSLH